MTPDERDALVKAIGRNNEDTANFAQVHEEVMRSFGDVGRQMNRLAQQISASVTPAMEEFRRAFSRAVAEHYGVLPTPEPTEDERRVLAARQERLRARESSSRPRVRLEPQRAIERSPERP